MEPVYPRGKSTSSLDNLSAIAYHPRTYFFPFFAMLEWLLDDEGSCGTGCGTDDETDDETEDDEAMDDDEDDEGDDDEE